MEAAGVSMTPKLSRRWRVPCFLSSLFRSIVVVVEVGIRGGGPSGGPGVEPGVELELGDVPSISLIVIRAGSLIGHGRQRENSCFTALNQRVHGAPDSTRREIRTLNTCVTFVKYQMPQA